jgi:hypothetical protein
MYLPCYLQGKRPAGLKLANQAVQLLQKAGGRDKLMAEVSSGGGQGGRGCIMCAHSQGYLTIGCACHFHMIILWRMACWVGTPGWVATA